jgi:hypothetical protein
MERPDRPTLPGIVLLAATTMHDSCEYAGWPL